ncbi:MAG: hypothetical protein ACNYWU_05345 [Desulfobacterales bacterium]
MSPAWAGLCSPATSGIHALIRGDLSGMRLFDVSFYHSVKLPAGATCLPSPGDIVRSIPPDIEKQNKEELFRIGKYEAL